MTKEELMRRLEEIAKEGIFKFVRFGRANETLIREYDLNPYVADLDKKYKISTSVKDAFAKEAKYVIDNAKLMILSFG